MHHAASTSGIGDTRMALNGSAALAMWWQVSPEVREEFEDWHSHEHFPERLSIPGFRRASRWTQAAGGEGVFVMYELEAYAVMSSDRYLARLNAPSHWSMRMMSHHRNMIRTQCRVLDSRGTSTSAHAITARLSPAPGREAQLRSSLKAMIDRLHDAPGLTGMHLLQHQAPPIAQTTEQKMRGSDQAADWILIACGYDALRVAGLAEGEWTAQALASLGAMPSRHVDHLVLSHTATPADMEA